MTREMWLFAQFMVQTLDGVTTGLMMEIALNPKDRRWSRRLGRIACYYIMVLLICLPSWLMHYKILPVINLAFTIVGTVGLTMKLYGASLKQAVILFGFYYLLSGVGELSLAYLYPEAFAIQVDWTQDVMFEPLFTAMVLMGFLKLAFAVFYRQKGPRKTEKDLFPAVFLISLFLLALMLIPIYKVFNGDSPNPDRIMRSMYIMFTYFTCLMLISGIIFAWQSRTNAKSLDKARVFSDLQNGYYTSLEQNSQAQAKLIHDYKNVLLAARSLLASGQEAEARSILSGFQQRLEKTQAPLPEETNLIAQMLKSEELTETDLKQLLQDLPSVLPELEVSSSPQEEPLAESLSGQ